MSNIDTLKKIRIVLFILIVIAIVILIISAIKSKKEENYLIDTSSAEMTETIEEENLVEEIGVSDGGDVKETEDTSWDEEAEDTKVDVDEEKNSEKNDSTPYYIKINYTANCVTIYKKDDSGKYTIPVKAIVCSTGTATPTSGVYKMSQKYRWHQLNGGVYGQYCSRITGHILFHSVPYAKNTPDSLKYVAYDKLGTKASAGCIRLTTEDAMWIYNNCPSGTYVEFYSSSNPGPLGKPTAQKISSNVACRNWDPTDPTKGNPWHTYTKQTVEENNIPEIPDVHKEENLPSENVPQVNENEGNSGINNENNNNGNNNQNNNEVNNSSNNTNTEKEDNNATNENVNNIVEDDQKNDENTTESDENTKQEVNKEKE